MNWKLTLQLSLFGLIMAIATVFWIPSNIEWIFWLVIFIFCAYTLSRKCDIKLFWNGFIVGIFNCVYVTSAHVFFYTTYLANHQAEMESMKNSAMAEHPQIMMLITGPIIGILSGCVLGLFAIIAKKLFKK